MVTLLLLYHVEVVNLPLLHRVEMTNFPFLHHLEMVEAQWILNQTSYRFIRGPRFRCEFLLFLKWGRGVLEVSHVPCMLRSIISLTLASLPKVPKGWYPHNSPKISLSSKSFTAFPKAFLICCSPFTLTRYWSRMCFLSSMESLFQWLHEVVHTTTKVISILTGFC